MIGKGRNVARIFEPDEQQIPNSVEDEVTRRYLCGKVNEQADNIVFGRKDSVCFTCVQMANCLCALFHGRKQDRMEIVLEPEVTVSHASTTDKGLGGIPDAPPFEIFWIEDIISSFVRLGGHSVGCS